MIKSASDNARFRVRFSNGTESGRADATADKGGSGEGFRPHELLEAALASCMSMSVQMYAQRHALPLEQVAVEVVLDRSRVGQTVFGYSLTLGGPLSDEQREQLLQVAEACPVRTTLSKAIGFELT
jgi:putative redox protein